MGLKINNIVIVGGGSAGWMTAATLIKEFPDKSIYVIESKDVPTVGVGESTLGSIRQWTRFIGLDEKSFFATTDASYKLSIKFTDFYKKDSGSFHYPFGQPYHEDQSTNPFHRWHLKKYFNPETKPDDMVRCLFPASALFESNKFSKNLNGEFANFNPNNDMAYHFDATKFGVWLRDVVCLPSGVNHIISTVKSVNTNESGISELIMEDGSLITADLFIDCTGFKSMLLGDALQEPFVPYSKVLPNNSAWATRIPYKDKEKELEGFTNCTAIENGWCWNIPLWSRIGTGYVYSDKYVSDEEALNEFKKYLMSDKMVVPRTLEEVELLEFKKISMRVGIHEKTFVKNVVAIGLSAGFIEPLESNGLFSVHEFLLRLIDILQRNEINQFDRDMYNVEVKRIFDNFAKFVVLHYALSHRDDTQYWRDAQNINVSELDGDPYTIHYGRSDAFYNMAWRYMDNWGHPNNNAGIPFIATGMNLFMMNKRRVMDLEFRNNTSYRKPTSDMVDIWNKRKNTWKINAALAPSLMKFLEENFYKESK
jgi:tryptophan halogenase